MSADELSPVLWVNYTRITLVSKTSRERLTIDVNLSFRDEESTKTYPCLVIAEVKQDRSGASQFITLMRLHHIGVIPISKYCLGLASVNKKIKMNNFKEKLHHINKICDAKV